MLSMSTRKGMPRRFREMLRSGETFVQPGAFNAQCAKMVEAAAFKTICVSGYGMSATLLGKPDVGLMTLTEVVQMTGYICDAVEGEWGGGGSGGGGGGIETGGQGARRAGAKRRGATRDGN